MLDKTPVEPPSPSVDLEDTGVPVERTPFRKARVFRGVRAGEIFTGRAVAEEMTRHIIKKA